MLGRLYVWRSEKKELFIEPKELPGGEAVVAVKIRKLGHAKKSSASPRIFCSDEDGNDDDEWRGFFCRLIGRNESEA